MKKLKNLTKKIKNTVYTTIMTNTYLYNDGKCDAMLNDGVAIIL